MMASILISSAQNSKDVVDRYTCLVYSPNEPTKNRRPTCFTIQPGGRKDHRLQHLFRKNRERKHTAVYLTVRTEPQVRLEEVSYIVLSLSFLSS